MNTGRFHALRQQFLEHTCAELQQLLRSLSAAQQGDVQALNHLKLIAHRIHGSGAMLGFDQISRHAGRLERVLRRAEGTSEPTDWPVVTQLIQQLSSGLQELDAQRKSDEQKSG